MRKKVCDKAPRIKLPGIDGKTFETERLKGKPYLLSFFRFASCPFCNMRLHELVKHFNEFENDFTIVAVFDSPLANLAVHARGHNALFPILADVDNKYYKEYAIEHSMMGVLKGMIFRMPTLIKAMLKGYIPITIKGSMTTMPADFLIDENGIIQRAHYGRDEGDHLSIDDIKAFAKFSGEEIEEECMPAACACT
jgi:peroxiredoxin Q/BCP